MSAEAHYELARTLHAKGQLDDALASYRKAIELNPGFAAAYHGAGNAYQAKRQLDDALKCFQQAIELMPEVAVSHNNLANIFLEKGQFEKAIIHYQKAMQLQPDSPATNRNLAVAYYGLGHALLEKEQLDDAVHAYRQALQLNPEFKEVYYDLGMRFMKKEQFDEALACFLRLTALDPGVPAIPIAARTNEGMRALLMTMEQVITGEIKTQPRRVQGTPEFQRAVEKLVPEITHLLPEVPNPRWIAIRLLDGDSRVQQALLSGELVELAGAQRRADTAFSRKIALDGRQ